MWTAHRLHRWAGLGAGLWLAVLGATGLVLDHRDWRWLWQAGVPEALVPERIIAKRDAGAMRLYQVVDAEQRLAGGPAGLWWSNDRGRHWQPTDFGQPGVPYVHQLLRLEGRWVLATNDGLWLTRDKGRSAEPWLLAGHPITALAPRDRHSLFAVEDRSRMLVADLQTRQMQWLTLGTIPAVELPDRIDLSRLVHDLHFGRGLSRAPWSLWWSDITAVGLCLLPLSGFLYWWLPRYWRRRRRRGRLVSKPTRQRLARWLYRAHAPVIGLAIVVPLLYLSVTGILLDHMPELRGWMKQTRLGQPVLPPVYRLPAWQNEIYAIVSRPGVPAQFSVGTRLGLFATRDGGRHFRRVHLAGEQARFVWTARQDDGLIVLGGMGGPNYLGSSPEARRPDQAVSWRPLPQGAPMPTDITRDADGLTLWKTPRGLKAWDGHTFQDYPAALPQLEYVPWFYVMDGLHSGLLIHPQWKWINDAVALLAVVLVVTGLWRWWRVKWL
jgi:hypothetical protein